LLLAPLVPPEDLQITGISHSQDETFKRCNRRWAFEKILKLNPEEDAKALIYGDGGHTALEKVLKGSSVTEGIQAGLNALRENGAHMPYFNQLSEWLPHHITGFFTHCYPSFYSEWEIVGVEQRGDHYLSNIIYWRGMLDLLACNRRTGGYGVFDFKFSSDMYVQSLSRILGHSPQLARYTMAFYRIYNTWPETVGYIFLKKPKGKEAVTNLSSDPNKYTIKSIPVTPKFAEYAISVEESDIQSALEMRRQRERYHKEGIVAIDTIPANFSNCFMYNSMCGFADGCHSGKPLHKLMKDAKDAV